MNEADLTIVASTAGLDGLPSWGYTEPAGSVPAFAPAGVKKADPPKDRESVAAGWWPTLQTGPQVLLQEYDDLTWQFGPRLYEVMDLDEALHAAHETWKEAVLADRLGVLPAVEPEEDEDPDPDDAAESDDAGLGETIAESCARVADGLWPALHQTLDELLDARHAGHVLAETTYRDGTGPDAGRLVPATLKVKPRWSYYFVVDRFRTVVGYLAYTGPAGWRVLPPDRFCLAAWRPRSGDPRGSSAYRQAARAWMMKQQIDPLYFRQLALWAGTRAVGMLPPNAQKVVVDGVEKTAQQDMADSLTSFLTTSQVLVHQYDAKVYTLQSESPAGGFVSAYDLLDRRMVRSQLGTTSLNMEAAHYSQAGGEVGQDVVGNKVRHGKEWLADVVRWGLFRPYVALNWGEDVAARLTPRATFGGVEHQDFSRFANAIARLNQSGIWADNPAQRREVLRKLLHFPRGKPIDPLKLLAQAAPPPPAPGGRPGTAQPAQVPPGGAG